MACKREKEHKLERSNPRLHIRTSVATNSLFSIINFLTLFRNLFGSARNGGEEEEGLPVRPPPRAAAGVSDRQHDAAPPQDAALHLRSAEAGRGGGGEGGGELRRGVVGCACAGSPHGSLSVVVAHCLV